MERSSNYIYSGKFRNTERFAENSVILTLSSLFDTILFVVSYFEFFAIRRRLKKGGVHDV